MTHNQKIQYMRQSMGLSHMAFSLEQLDLLVSQYELIIEKEGNTTLDDITMVQLKCKDAEALRAIKEMDKINTIRAKDNEK